MSVSEVIIERDISVARDPAPARAVSWAAIFAGAAAAASLSLILLVLGSGFGFAAASPWASRGASAEAITWSTIAWITFMALASSGLGGYIAGRLRERWAGVHTDEVYFRDTAHGFLAWAVATLATAALLTSAIGAILGVGAQAGIAATASGGASALMQAAPAPQSTAVDKDGMPTYTLDSLFRLPMQTSESPATPTAQGQPASDMAASKTETAHIFANTLHTGPLSADDTRYAGRLIAQHTGLSQQEAEARVTTAYSAVQKNMQEAEAKAKQLADVARKNAAYASLWIFISLLIGAFFASLMAIFGGRQRDLT